MARLGQHECRQTENPRQPGFCACGKRLPPERPTTRRRDLGFEKNANEDAAKGVCDYEYLFHHAQNRALRLSGEYVGDPMMVRLDRDRPRDVMEELADGVNHGVWWAQDNLDHPNRYLMEAAIRFMHAAYDCVRRIDD